MIKCPHCGHEFPISAIKSEKKAEAARKNGAKGGRPKGKVVYGPKQEKEDERSK